MSELPAALRDPVTWGAPPGTPVELRETHISWVALVGHRAFKVKKPVRLPFLDFSTAAKRRAACRAEVRLNRRLAPGTYRGLRPLGDEYAVEMRRFDESATLAARLAAGEDVAPQRLGEVGGLLARFHSRARPGGADGGAERVKRAMDDTFASLRALADPGLAVPVGRLERAAAAFLSRRWDELDGRARAGLVREGHGDLRAEHVVLSDPIEVVDCVEFSRALRCIDVAEDLAFLVMDLTLAGRDDLAAAVLAGYRDAGGDAGDDGLVAGLAAYRAQVRAKVCLLRAAQLPPESAAGEQQAAERHLQVAEQLAWRARGPVLIVICGPAASGKSTLAAALAESSGLPAHNSDVVRKRLAGLPPDRPAPARLYDRVHDAGTYAALLDLADERMRAGGGVVLDATFRGREQRRALEVLPTVASGRLLVVECHVPLSELVRRARERLRQARRVSDAGVEVARRQARQWRHWDDLAPGRHLIVRADGPAPALLAQIADAVDRD